MVTFEHYEAAHNIVVGRHAEQLEKEALEAGIRQAHEPDPALVPDGGRRAIDDTPHEPQTLQEALAGDWKTEFRAKSRAVGGRSDDEEMRRAGFGDVQGFLKARKQVEALVDEMGDGLGLDADYDPATGKYLTPQQSRRLALPQA